MIGKPSRSLGDWGAHPSGGFARALLTWAHGIEALGDGRPDAAYDCFARCSMWTIPRRIAR